MDKILYAGCAAAVIALIATVALIVKKRGGNDCLVCVREDWMTAVMGAMLIALGIWISYLKLTDPTISGTDAQSYWYVAGFSLLCHLMGDFALLYTFVKRVELHEDRVEGVSVFGKVTTLRWEDVVKVDKSMMSRATKLKGSDGTVISVSGSNKSCDQFTAFAKPKVASAQGSNLLQHVERRLRNNRL